MIDGHAHVFLRTLPLVDGRRYSPLNDAPLSEYRALLELHDIAGAILVQPSFLGTDNRFLLQALSEAGRWVDGPSLSGVVVVDPDTPRETLASMRAAGVIGARLNLYNVSVPDLTAREWSIFFDRINALGWHIELHIEGDRLPNVLFLLLDSCERIVVDHFGLPDPLSPLDCPGFRGLLKAPAGRVWVKASGPSRVFPQICHHEAAARCGDLYRQLEDALGQDALIWGSDWPWTQQDRGQSYEDSLAWLASWRDGGTSHPPRADLSRTGRLSNSRPANVAVRQHVRRDQMRDAAPINERHPRSTPPR